MSIDKEQIKKKIYEKLPDLLPQLIKTVVVHLVMLLYHISMSPWVTAIKVEKALRSYKTTNEKDTAEEPETDRRMRRRGMRHRSQRKFTNSSQKN